MQHSRKPKRKADPRNNLPMPTSVQVALESWSCPVGLTFAVILAGVLYLRGWLHLHSASVNAIASWRAGSFFVGLFLIWVAVGSPLAALDHEFLTVHMIQHLLLMTLAAPMILLQINGAPPISTRRTVRTAKERSPVARCAAVIAPRSSTKSSIASARMPIPSRTML